MIIKLALVNEIKDVPTDIKLFASGVNKTQKGDFIYDPKQIDQLKENQILADGRDLLPIDLAHLSLSDSPTIDANKSYGWFELSYEQDGIWARNIQWTKQGKELLENREFRFFSPAFDIDKENGTILKVHNFALTNNPATISQLPLVADIKETSNMEEEDKKENELVEEELSSDDLEEVSPEEFAALKEQLNAANLMVADLRQQLSSVQSELDTFKQAELDAKVAAEKEALFDSIAASSVIREYFSDKDVQELKSFVSLSTKTNSSENVTVLNTEKKSFLKQEKPDVVASSNSQLSTLRKQLNLPTTEELKRMAQLSNKN